MKTKTAVFGILALSAAILAGALVAGRAGTDVSRQSADDLYQAALLKKEAEGDLPGAIKIFQEILAKYPTRKDIAAKSQLQIGLCYEKLGFEEAEKAYQKVVTDYPDQTDAVNLAKKKLMNLTRIQTPSHQADGKFSMRRISEASSLWKGGSMHPQGRFLVFADRMNSCGDVAVFDLASGKVRRIADDATETEGADECAVSRDGKQIAYGWLNNSNGAEGLRLINMDGSEPRILYRDLKGIPMVPADWTPDGKNIVAYHQGIALVSRDDGSIRMLKRGDSKLRYLAGRIRISPDGRYIAYDWPPEASRASRDIFVLSVDGSNDAPLIEESSNDILLDWCPDGQSLLFRSDRTGSWDAWRIRVKDGRAGGPPELIKKDIGEIQPLGFTHQGFFYFMNSTGGWDIRTAKIDLSAGRVIEGPKNLCEKSLGRNVSAAWSPDGESVAYIASAPGRGLVIRIRSEETGEEREISPQPGMYGIEWFPDGSSLKVYGEDEDGNRGLFRIDVRTGAVETLLKQTSEAGLNRARLGPDGKVVFFTSCQESADITSIAAFDLSSRQKNEILSRKGKISCPSPSPDGSWLAFEIEREDGSGRDLAVMPVKGGETRTLAVSNSMGDFAWTPDSKQILFAKFVPGSGYGSSRQELWSVPVRGGAPKNLGLESRLMWLLTVHPDGIRIAYSDHQSKAEIWVMENFLPVKK
jgi:Tol biopolymer transport system component